ncbi:MAG: glycoside hydrolase family 2 TIM barrel-domain containing protein [Candidatus Kapaibacteriales bacterium]
MEIRFFLLNSFLLIFTSLWTFTFGQDDFKGTDPFIQSSLREVIPLSGVWEASADDKEWFSAELPKVFYNQNKITFRKIIKISQQLFGDYYWHLYFLGISDEVEIFWNGQSLGRFVSENTPFWVSIPKKYGIKSENELKLLVSPSQSFARLVKEKYPLSRKITTGVSRDFFLIRTSPIWINEINASVKWYDNIRAELNLNLQVSSFELERILLSQAMNQFQAKGLFTCEIQMVNKQNNQIVSTSNLNFEIASFRKSRLLVSLPVSNFQFWDFDSPNLYEIVAKISRSGVYYDEYRIEIGFRKVEIKRTSIGNSFVINGKPFVLKGVDFIEDFDYYNSGNSLKKIKQDIILLKSLGINVVRFMQVPPNPAFLSFCNKYGILVLVDIPLYYVPKELFQKSDLFFRYQTIGESLVKNYSTFPAFLGLGLGEGLQEGSEIIDNFYQSLLQKIKPYGSFLVYKTVILKSKHYSFQDFDFIIVKDNWRYVSSSDISEKLREHLNYCTKPIILDFGTIINPNNRNGYNDKLSIEYQAQHILQRFNLSQKHQLAGSFVWTYNDYFLENPLFQVANVEPYECYAGLVNNIRQARLAFYVLRALYNNEDTPIINPGIVEASFPFIYVFLGILISLIVGSMLYRSRRFREYFFRSFFHSYNFFADIRDRRIISNLQTFFLLISLSLIVGGYISSFFDFYKNTEVFRYLILICVPNIFLREWVFRVSWSAELSILFFSAIFCLILLLIMLILRFFAILSQRKVFFDDLFKMVVWGSLPIILLLPLTVFISRIFLVSEYFSYFFNTVFVAVLFWSFLRMIRSIWIVFDLPKRRVYYATFVFIFFVLIIVLTYFEYNYNIVEYITFFADQII